MLIIIKKFCIPPESEALKGVGSGLQKEFQENRWQDRVAHRQNAERKRPIKVKRKIRISMLEKK